VAFGDQTLVLVTHSPPTASDVTLANMVGVMDAEPVLALLSELPDAGVQGATTLAWQASEEARLKQVLKRVNQVDGQGSATVELACTLLGSLRGECCAWSGLKASRDGLALGVDRLAPAKKYTSVGNLVPCESLFNQLKGTLSERRFRRLARKVLDVQLPNLRPLDRYVDTRAIPWFPMDGTEQQ
jgi:hypothetical protein